MNYFIKDKNYRMLYLDNFFRHFGNSIYAVFTPVILYKSGVSISMILFIFMIQFLIMGLLTPTSGILTKKIGVANTKLLSYLLKVFSLILVLYVKNNIMFYFIIAFVQGISGAINNPLNTYMPSKIVEEKVRGRYNSFSYILRSISGIIAYIFTGIFIIENNNVVIILTVLISYIIAYSSLLLIEKNKIKYKSNERQFSMSIKYLKETNKNVKFKLVSCFRGFIIIERLIAVPLYLYISLLDIKKFTVLYVVSTIIEMLSLFISGSKYDKNNLRTFNLISYIRIISSSIFLIIRNNFVLIINQSLYKLVDNVYDSSYCALSQSKVKEDIENIMLLSIVHEMCLCFSEFLILFILMFISFLNINITFITMFMGSILAIFINSILIRKWNK